MSIKIYLCSCLETTFQKSSVNDVEYPGHLLHDPEAGAGLTIDLFPFSSPNFYKWEGSVGNGVLYREGEAANRTGMLEKHGGANVFIRKSKERKMVKPSNCPKSHCPAPFQYSIG